MSRIGDQAAAIATIVDAVANSGVVWSYRPLPKSGWAEFIETFSVEIPPGFPHIRAWTTQFVGETREGSAFLAGAGKQRHYTSWKLRFYLGVEDPGTEVTFRAVVEAVADALDNNRTLSGVVIDHDPVDIIVPNNGDGVLLDSFLCHTAEIDFRAWVEVNFPIV